MASEMVVYSAKATTAVVPLFDTNVFLEATIGKRYRPETFAALSVETRVSSIPLWAYEFNHVVTKATRLKKEPISKAAARKAYRNAHDLVADLYRLEDRRFAFELSLRHQCSPYDAEFIYWAQLLGEPLVTLDERLRNTFPRDTRPLEDYLAERGYAL